MTHRHAQHTHDCDECVFLGRDGTHDHYFCPRDTDEFLGDGLIARFGSDGPDYLSMPVSVVQQVVDSGGWSASESWALTATLQLYQLHVAESSSVVE